MDRTAEITAEKVDDNTAGQAQNRAQPKGQERDWGRHPLNLRVSLPTPFGRWYVTLIAGRERRRKERLIEDREKNPLTTMPNLMFLMSTGIVATAFLILVTAIVLVHGFGWSIHLTVPA